MNSEIRSSQLSSRCSGKRRCCHDLREVAPLSRVGGICAALTAPRKLQRNMYELRNASVHQWFALVGVAGVGVALAWWMLAGGQCGMEEQCQVGPYTSSQCEDGHILLAAQSRKKTGRPVSYYLDNHPSI